MADKLKFALALLLVIGGVAGFYVLSEQALIWRTLSVLAGLGAGTAVAWFTNDGQRFMAFFREAVAETKKVVWPTRKDTVQTTAIVFVFVLAIAIVMWISDKGLQWIIYDVVLGWGKS